MPAPRKVPVWDLPTRAFHWTLVLLFIFSFATVKIGGDWMVWHERSGMAILTLIAFRLIWGFVGGEHARFASFVRGPGVTIRYALDTLRGGGARTLGHNPLGAGSVIALILSVGTQAVTGLFVDDEIVNRGPLANQVSSTVVAWATSIHRWNEKVMIALVLLHIAAILFYLIKKKDNLVRPMISGEKDWDGPADPTRAHGSTGLALMIVIAIAAAVYYFIARKVGA
jgi:cytochrome b